MFTSREIATAAWLGVLSIWALSQRSMRESALGVVRTLLHWKLLAILIGLAVYTSGAVWLLSAVGIWNASLLKDTLIWYVFSGTVLAFRSLSTREGEEVGGLKDALREQLKVVVLLEFLVATYTFPLPVELALLPAVTVVAMMQAVAETRKEFGAVRKLLGAVLGLVGLAILVLTVREAASDLRNLGSFDTLRQLALPPLLTFLIIPCVYLIILAARYEMLFLRLRHGPKKPAAVSRYAQRRLVRHLGLRATRVKSFTGAHAAELMRIETESDVDALLRKAQADDGSHGRSQPPPRI